MELGSGGLTKYNRTQQYPKDHWIDAAMAGLSGKSVFLNPQLQKLLVTCCSRNNRRMVKPDKYGFPSGRPKQCSRVKGFQTGDIVKAVVASGKNKGSWIGRVVVRKTGYFQVGERDSISYIRLTKLQANDGFQYQL